MILTTVRSLPEEDIPDRPSYLWVNENLGFVGDEHLMNVAITRAREALCIIGRYCELCVSTVVQFKGYFVVYQRVVFITTQQSKMLNCKYEKWFCHKMFDKVNTQIEIY